MSHLQASITRPTPSQATDGWPRRRTPIALAAALMVLLLAPSCAFAGFSQPFLRQITRTEADSARSCTLESEDTRSSTCLNPGGLAVDEAGDLWVGDYEEQNKEHTPPQPEEDALGEFNSTGAFLKTLKLEGNPAIEKGRNVAEYTRPDSLSIDYQTGDFYVTGEGDAPYVEVFDSAGQLVALWEGFGGPAYVAVDNATESLEDPSACSVTGCIVYVSQALPNESESHPEGVEKFSTAGITSSFTCSTCAYVQGNEITGTPRGKFRPYKIGSVAVDAKGDIYVVDNEYEDGVAAVVEYRPSGEFVQAFTGQETPGLAGQTAGGGFGGGLEGVAVDSVTGLIDVSVSESQRSVGAVDEFNPLSGRFVSQVTETSPGKRLRSAFAVTADPHGDLYVVDKESRGEVVEEPTNEQAVDEYGPGGFIPNFKLAGVTDSTSASAVLNGLVSPESTPEAPGLSECYFEYVTEADYNPLLEDPYEAGGAAPCEPGASEIPEDAEYHAVHAGVKGLVSGAVYRYRLVAKSSGKLGAVGDGEPLEFTAPGPPKVIASSVANISSMYVDLHAQIDPVGADTTYYFEYGPTAAYGEVAPAPTEAAPHGADIGSGGPRGDAPASVVQQIGGLTPGTTYHFRAVARGTFINADGKEETVTEPGLDGTFKTMPAPTQGLPDGRAYELLTPPSKGSAEDMFGDLETQYHWFLNNSVGYASESGEQFLLETQAPFGPYPAMEHDSSSPDGGHNVYVFARSEKGWQTIPFAQPSLGVQSVHADVFSPENFSELGIDDAVGAELSAAGTHGVAFLASLGGASSGPSFTELLRDPGPTADHTRMVGASRNFDRVVVASKSHTLAPGTETQDPGTTALYEAAGGKLAPVNVNDKGALLSRCGAVLGQNNAGAGASHNAVSTDGAKIFFTAPDPEGAGAGCWDPGTEANAPQLYTRSGGRTTQVSKPEAGVVEEGSSEEGEAPVQHPAIYVGASEDGSKVFFITETELTREAAELRLHDRELYEYNAEAPEGKRLVRVSRGERGSPVAAGAPAKVYVVDAISGDGNVVYFAALGQLAPGAPVVEGEETNLYHYDTAAGEISYVATVDRRDYPSDEASDWWDQSVASKSRPIFENPVEIALDPSANWYTTPGGRFLLFATTRELDPNHSTAAAQERDCPNLNSGGVGPNGHCSEVYRYDASRAVSEGREGEDVPDNPLCVSCDAGGEAPASPAFFGHSAGLETRAAGPVRAMSDNGSYVFFDTADPLVPQDVNKALDVYEWHEGVVSLISSGTDTAPSYFLGASSDGSNVFFGTHARLVPQDTDTAGDVYDARICTTQSQCIKRPSAGTAECEGDACQSPPPAPLEATPTSLTFSGAGNLTGSVTPTGTVKKATPKRRTTAQIKAEKLARALRACAREPTSKRAACKRQARARYAPAKKRGKR
ncbi:MAG TPA: hypothetical protein VK756_06430 [Solirubrobacteraceae bacterium]|jgi:hypothetical protein|nr:hypothetical protein [Solirubrobacteraceae bacterium]